MKVPIHHLVLAIAIAALSPVASANDTYKFDPSGSTIGFGVHQFLGTTHGTFTKFQGKIDVDRDRPPFLLPEACDAQHAAREVAEHDCGPDIRRIETASRLDDRAQQHPAVERRDELRVVDPDRQRADGQRFRREYVQRSGRFGDTPARRALQVHGISTLAHGFIQCQNNRHGLARFRRMSIRIATLRPSI